MLLPPGKLLSRLEFGKTFVKVIQERRKIHIFQRLEPTVLIFAHPIFLRNSQPVLIKLLLPQGSGRLTGCFLNFVFSVVFKGSLQQQVL